MANDKQGALKLLNDLKLEAQVRDWNYDVAVVYAGLGDSDSAFASLEKAFRNREGQIALIKVEPKLEPLRKDARYADLLKRMNLE